MTGEEIDLEVFLLLKKQIASKRSWAMEIVTKYGQLGIMLEPTTELEDLQTLIDRSL